MILLLRQKVIFLFACSDVLWLHKFLYNIRHWEAGGLLRDCLTCAILGDTMARVVLPIGMGVGIFSVLEEAK